MALRTIVILYIVTSEIPMLSHTLEASDSCSISILTVERVENCPDSEEKWKEAAARKKCEDYAIFCSEPEKLEYHCVINSFINETLEVCAYTQNIVLGHCTDYSVSGNLIKQNWRTNCKVFEKKPCPLFYLSTEAYKYPGCYELTKRPKKLSRIHHTVLSSKNNIMHTTTNSSRLLLTKKKQEFDNSTDDDVLIIICSISFIASIVFFVVIAFICVLKYVTASKTKEYLSIVHFSWLNNVSIESFESSKWQSLLHNAGQFSADKVP